MAKPTTSDGTRENVARTCAAILEQEHPGTRVSVDRADRIRSARENRS